MLYMVTFTINIPPMLAYIPYMDPMGNWGGTTLQISDSHPPCASKDPSRVPQMIESGVLWGALRP